MAADADAVDELIAFCDGLPLALAVVAARVATDPRLALKALAEELADERKRLDALDTGDPVTSAQTVFSWSYQRLSPEAARVFRLLSVATGPDISLVAAEALVAADVSEAFVELSRLHLLTERVPGRFAFHDLVRAYARARSEVEDSREARLQAVRRMVDHYLHTLDAADRLLRKSRTELDLPPLSEGVRPHHLDDRAKALAWCDAEYANLVAAAHLAEEHGLLRHAWQLPTALWGYLHLREVPTERLRIGSMPLNTVRVLGDRYGEAVTLHTIATALDRLRRYEEAGELFEQALRIREEIGHEHGVAVTLDQWAVNNGLRGRSAEAKVLHRRAVEQRRAQGDTVGLATALNNYAMTLAQIEEYDAAVAACTEAYEILEQDGPSNTLVSTLDTLGTLHMARGRTDEAVVCFERVLAMPDGLMGDEMRVIALDNTAAAVAELGRIEEARVHLQTALEILERNKNPRADELRAKIDALTGE